MKERHIHAISLIENNKKGECIAPEFLSEKATDSAHKIHQGLPSYERTPLVDLREMANELGVQRFYVKDESKRFGLNAFKGLGGIYALSSLICRKLGLDVGNIRFEDLKREEYRESIQKMVFITTTDGNHGKGVSWAAGQLGCEAHIYMPAGSSERRAQAIRDVNERAVVKIMETGYDDTVRYTAELAQKNEWYLVQDTSWEGYKEIPTTIIQGYTTMVYEACKQMEEEGIKPTHVFVQAGVGAMAGGVVGYLANHYKEDIPKIGIVEPENIACIYQSAKEDDLAPHAAVIQEPTIMAGLNCGEPCTITWPILRDFSKWFLKCPDYVSAYGMRRLAASKGNDPKVISGESGAVTTGLVNFICRKSEYRELRELLELDKNSVILCFNTEGDTDPEEYERIVFEGKEPITTE